MRLRSGITLALGLASALLLLDPARPNAGVQGDRVIRLHNTHTKETADILYKKDGKFVADGLKKASWLLRDWRRNEATEMDPELIDLLWEIHTELGSQEPIHIISGYRSRATNDMLRKSVGGQASESRHILGKAADVYFPDVPLKRLRYSALIRERGGVGYYPTSGSPFVHVDTDRVRAWPRLPRAELALLFPNGKTQHVPADGEPLTPADVKVARVQQADLAKEIADYRASRQDLSSTTRVKPTVLAAALPQLRGQPAPAPRPVRASISESDRAGLTTLAAMAAGPERALAAPPPARVPQPMVASLGPSLPTSLLRREQPASPEPILSEASSSPVWNSAPAWDDEHPDELSYRPFAIAPLLADDPATEPDVLKQLVAPNIVRTLETLDQGEYSPSLALRSGRQRVGGPEQQSFRGPAVAVNTYFGKR